MPRNFRNLTPYLMHSPYIDLLLQLACIDGEATDIELELIREIGSSENFSDEEFEEALSTIDEAPVVGSLTDLNLQDRIRMVVNLILVIKADGRIEPEEMEFSLPIIQKFGIDKESFWEFLQEVMDREVVHSGMDLNYLVTDRFFGEGFDQRDFLGLPEN